MAAQALAVRIARSRDCKAPEFPAGWHSESMNRASGTIGGNTHAAGCAM
jgi:hypothetical protein